MQQHKPVLLAEVIEQLQIRADGIYVDGTFGRGGHARAILERLGAAGRLMMIDQDAEAIEFAKQQTLFQDPRCLLRQGPFTQMTEWVRTAGWLGKINGILLDLGVSSPQLDQPERGFSFLRDGPLDMRMNAQQGMTAAEWVNRASVRELAQVFKDYGEERFARRIAQAIVKARQEQPLLRTGQLAEIVAAAHPRWEPHKHPATRVFQAIRIYVNQELAELEQVLKQSVELLAPQGRLLVISFHSLEERIVKRFIQREEQGGDFPPDLPIPESQRKQPRLKRVGRAIWASSEEIDSNPRARSAVLRVAEKIS